MFTILVVEDDLPLRKMMSAFLSMNGYRTQTAGNGEEALAVMERVLPDLVIADVMMPVMDGWQLTEEIRRLEQKRLLRGGKPGAGARFVGRKLGRAV